MINRILRKIEKRTRSLIGKDFLDLSGDRFIEWSWVFSELPKGKASILDIGPGSEFLCSATAARNGAEVTCFDVRRFDPPFTMQGLDLVTGDLQAYDFKDKKFDAIINVSVIEHIGLGRYGDANSTDGDIKVMQKLARWLKPNGKMLFTIPVGKDAIHSPLHRVYGQQRLPSLLGKYHILKEEYWKKKNNYMWEKASRDIALNESSSKSYYALGLFVLEAGN